MGDGVVMGLGCWVEVSRKDGREVWMATASMGWLWC